MRIFKVSELEALRWINYYVFIYNKEDNEDSPPAANSPIGTPQEPVPQEPEDANLAADATAPGTQEPATQSLADTTAAEVSTKSPQEPPVQSTGDTMVFEETAC